MAAGELTIGTWVTLGHPSIAEILANAGFDWVAIDTEHSVITIDAVQALIRAIEPSGAEPLVRLANNDPVLIKRVMDAGAHGIIVPQVDNADLARAAVAAAYYPPTGTRGVGLARAQGYGADFEGYLRRLAEETVVVVMIEHAAAVEDIDAILSTSGVDGYLIGPYDLSASIGIPGQFDDERVVTMIERIREAGVRHGKPGGLHVVEPDPERFAVHTAQGFRFLAYSMDVRILDSVARRDLASLRQTGGS